jgi:deaminated glutathione amidase
MKVAVVQMVSCEHLDQNKEQARILLTQAAQAGAEMAVLPEYFCLIGQHDSDKLRIAEAYGVGPLQDWLGQQARDLGLWLVAGTIPLRAPAADRVFNSCLVFNAQGLCVQRYDKMHLFRYANATEFYDEARVLQAGTQPAQFDVPSRDGHTWRIGMSICYDVRFAELYRYYASQGADLLLVPSAFTYTTGQAHWEVLLRARAIENLAFVAAAAQGGEHSNGRRTWGHSSVIDPWGQVLGTLPTGAGVVCTELDAAVLAQRRIQLPALAHRML